MELTRNVAVRESMVNIFLGDRTPPVTVYTEKTRNIMIVNETVNSAKLIALIIDDLSIVLASSL